MTTSKVRSCALVIGGLTLAFGGVAQADEWKVAQGMKRPKPGRKMKRPKAGSKKAPKLGEPTSGEPQRQGAFGKAQQQQFQGEMDELATRNAWGGVERKYQDLLRLENATIDGSYHVLGAQAARDRGDIGAVRTRLKAAGAAPGALARAESAKWLAELNGTYGQANIKKHRRHELKMEPMPFASAQRKAVEFCAAKIKSKRKKECALPAGKYSLGKSSFTVTAGKTTIVK